MSTRSRVERLNRFRGNRDTAMATGADGGPPNGPGVGVPNLGPGGQPPPGIQPGGAPPGGAGGIFLQNLLNRITQLENQHNASQETFVSNPYQGNINPTTSNGLKMYQSATNARSTLLNPKIKTKKEFLDAMASDSARFGWGSLINQVGVGGESYSILKDVQKLDVDKVRQHTSKFLYQDNSTDVPPENHNMTLFAIDPENNNNHKNIYYARVKINMIGQRIWNSLSQQAQTSLQTHMKKVLWKTASGEDFYDGPTMLQIIIKAINPSTRVGVTTLKDQLRAITLPGHNHNVSEMFSHQTRIYNEILQRGGTHDDIMYDTFKALGTTTNDEFETFVKDLKSKWETQEDDGNDLSHDSLIEKCNSKYNNLVEQKTWKDNQGKNAKLVALATQVKTLEQKLASNSNQGGSGTGSYRGNQNGKNGRAPEAWRLNKTLGDSVEKDNKTWYWCPHQHNDGKGMYVTHKAEDHTLWKEDKKEYYKKRQEAFKNKRNGASQKPSDNTLQLNDTLKAAMVTKFKCSENEVNQFLNRFSQSGN